MVELMEKAISKLASLPVEEQERIAQLILEEIEDNQRWDELFAKSQGRWSAIVAQVYADDDAGLVEDLDIDDLRR